MNRDNRELLIDFMTWYDDLPYEASQVDDDVLIDKFLKSIKE